MYVYIYLLLNNIENYDFIVFDPLALARVCDKIFVSEEIRLSIFNLFEVVEVQFLHYCRLESKQDYNNIHLCPRIKYRKHFFTSIDIALLRTYSII